MKAILLSIKPKYVADILNGRKTIEVRKSYPKCDLPITVYIYCTKGKPRAILTDKGCVLANKLPVGGNSIYKSGYSLDGQVVAKFTLRKVEEIINECVSFDSFTGGNEIFEMSTETLDEKELRKKSCLDWDEIREYLNEFYEGIVGYAYHIEDLVIFDKPKELSEFWICTEKKCIFNECHKYMHCRKYLTKAPQSMMYVEGE